MNDKKVTIHDLKELAGQFIAEREWAPYHTPKNLSMNIVREASELMEKFLWVTTQESVDEVSTNRQEIEDELADVLLGILSFANATNIDLSKALQHKLQEAAKKYPVEKAKGRREKYNRL